MADTVTVEVAVLKLDPGAMRSLRDEPHLHLARFSWSVSSCQWRFPSQLITSRCGGS
jgi:hypothetical protein